MIEPVRTAELAAPVTYEPYSLGSAEADPMGSPIAAVGRVLKGRYPWAIGLSVVLATAGAIAGNTLPRPVYRSAGVIEVAPKVPRVLYESEEKGILPLFDSFIFSQAAIAGSRRVIDMAMESEEWKKTGRPHNDAEIARFQGQLGVGHGPRTQLIDIAFVDEDPDIAVTAVNAVIAAYMKVVAQRENESGLDRMHALENQQSSDNARLFDLRSAVLSATDGLGVESIDSDYRALVQSKTAVEGDIRDLEAKIAAAKGATPGKSGDPNHPLTDEEIGERDPTMQHLLQRKSELDDNLLNLTEFAGLGPNHQSVVDKKYEISVVQRHITERAEKYRQNAAGAPDHRDLSMIQLETEHANLVIARDRLEDDLKKLAQKRTAVQKLDTERAQVADRLETAKSQIEQINVESSLRGRISVLAWGDRPLSPDTDRRRPLAILGALGGVGVGFGLVLLWGLRESKMRHVVDVDGNAARGRFLGVVPEVREQSDPEDAGVSPEMGDYGVHHVRTMLQVRSFRRSTIVALTSPSPGSGKTTLSLALGMSFAASGSRTLLIDCDFVGRGMTSTMRSLVCDATRRAIAAAKDGTSPDNEARRGLMSVLIAARRMSFNDSQVAELLAAAGERANAGEQEFENSVHALQELARPGDDNEFGDHTRRGVMAALDGRPLQDCIIETGTPNLAMLPAGDACEEDAKSLSRAALERLVKACTERYDTVLIDSGPMLGSIEAACAAAAAGEVVMIVSRGERRPLVDEAMARIERIGARVAGVVFNRASTADFARSNYASRSKSAVADVA